jgi:hypothetical protein
MQAILPAIKIVGTVLAAKSLIEGLKEGNLFQAVLGGVGAYMGLSSLGAFASSGMAAQTASAATSGSQLSSAGVGEAGAAASAANAVTGADLANQVVSGASTPALSGYEAMMDTSFANTAGAGATAGTSASGGFFDGFKDMFDVGAAAPEAGGTALDLAMDAAEGPLSLGQLQELGGVPAESGGLFSDITGWMKDNKEMVGVAKDVIGGYAQAQSKQELLDRVERLAAERRARMGASVDPNALPRFQWDPQTRRLVPVQQQAQAQRAAV